MSNGLPSAIFSPFMSLRKLQKRACHIWAGSFRLPVPLAISIVGGSVCSDSYAFTELGKIRWINYPLSQLLTEDCFLSFPSDIFLLRVSLLPLYLLISLFHLNSSQLLGMSQSLIRPKADDFQIHIFKVDFTLGFTLIHSSTNRTASWIVNSDLKSHSSSCSSL